MPSFDIYPANNLYQTEELRPALESAVRHPLTQEIISEEVDEILASVDLARQNQGDRYYAIAVDAGDKVIGMMGLQTPDESMLAFATTGNPGELINAYILGDQRGTGVGRGLVSHLEAKAIEQGHDELLVNSGPRYMLSGWPFWRRMYGEQADVAKDYYGPSFDAMVWRKTLIKV
jgi:GNAT superfamily N-acetyltransferase